MWKHHRHDAFSARQPPTTGPTMLPTDHEASTSEKYLGRCLRGTMSQKMTWARVMMPPPPTPWMQRPVSRTPKSWATAQRAVPKVNSTSEAISCRCRPKDSETDAMTGWLTAEVRRYEVPTQKASTDEPASACAMFFRRSAASEKACWGRQPATHREDGDEDGCVERDHQRHEAQAEHDEPFVLGRRPCRRQS